MATLNSLITRDAGIFETRYKDLLQLSESSRTEEVFLKIKDISSTIGAIHKMQRKRIIKKCILVWIKSLDSDQQRTFGYQESSSLLNLAAKRLMEMDIAGILTGMLKKSNDIPVESNSNSILRLVGWLDEKIFSILLMTPENKSIPLLPTLPLLRYHLPVTNKTEQKREGIALDRTRARIKRLCSVISEKSSLELASLLQKEESLNFFCSELCSFPNFKAFQIIGLLWPHISDDQAVVIITNLKFEQLEELVITLERNELISISASLIQCSESIRSKFKERIPQLLNDFVTFNNERIKYSIDKLSSKFRDDYTKINSTDLKKIDEIQTKIELQLLAINRFRNIILAVITPQSHRAIFRTLADLIREYDRFKLRITPFYDPQNPEPGALFPLIYDTFLSFEGAGNVFDDETSAAEAIFSAWNIVEPKCLYDIGFKRIQHEPGYPPSRTDEWLNIHSQFIEIGLKNVADLKNFRIFNLHLLKQYLRENLSTSAAAIAAAQHSRS